MRFRNRVQAVFQAGTVAACGDAADVPKDKTTHPNPTPPQLSTSLIPTARIVPANDWPEGRMPRPAEDLAVGAS